MLYDAKVSNRHIEECCLPTTNIQSHANLLTANLCVQWSRDLFLFSCKLEGCNRHSYVYPCVNCGDSFDREIDNEHSQTNDFILLNHMEAPKERSKKIKFFFVHAVESWDAEFYVKVNDDVYVNVDTLGAILSTHLDNPRVYMGCMKSGEVFCEPYFRHASGEIYAISRAFAQFISINRSILRIYAHDDVSAGSWFIGLDVKHVDDGKFCCSHWSTGSICAAV